MWRWPLTIGRLLCFIRVWFFLCEWQKFETIEGSAFGTSSYALKVRVFYLLFWISFCSTQFKALFVKSKIFVSNLSHHAQMFFEEWFWEKSWLSQSVACFKSESGIPSLSNHQVLVKRSQVCQAQSNKPAVVVKSTELNVIKVDTMSEVGLFI